MALITCPKCGKEFSDRALACPQCGMSINEVQSIIEASVKRTELQDRITKIVITCISAFAIVMIIMSLIYLITNYSSNHQQNVSSALKEQYNADISNQYDDSSTKWKEFAGTTYRASQFTSEGYQYYAFSYDRTGKGKYIIWWNYLGTDVVEDKMEFSIYKVESEGNYLYLYTYELNDPVKIQFQGSSLYSNTGDRYEIWR